MGQYTDTTGGRRDVVVIAHRFGWATTYGARSLDQVPGPRARLRRSRVSETRHTSLRPRWPATTTTGTPAAGSWAQPCAIRAAIFEGQDAAARVAGVSQLDRDQLLLGLVWPLLLAGRSAEPHAR